MDHLKIIIELAKKKKIIDLIQIKCNPPPKKIVTPPKKFFLFLPKKMLCPAQKNNFDPLHKNIILGPPPKVFFKTAFWIPLSFWYRLDALDL